MLIDVLTRVSKDTGLHPTDQRNVLMDLLNDAASLAYGLLDCNKIHREVTLVVPSNKIVALPSFIGEPKGIKEHTTETQGDLDTVMTPKFVSDLTLYRYKNWRDLGESAIHTDLNSVAQLRIESNVIESTSAVLTVCGATNLAARIEEDVTLDASPELTTNLFGPTIHSISCLTERTGDIIIKQDDGTEVATLYNTDSKTRYKLIDVSEFYWQLDTTLSETLIDLCYKVAKTKLLHNTDCFYAGDDYDDAWYHFAMFLHLAPLQGRGQDAKDQRALGVTALKTNKEASEGSLNKRITFGKNKYYNLFGKYLIAGACTRE